MFRWTKADVQLDVQLFSPTPDPISACAVGYGERASLALAVTWA